MRRPPFIVNWRRQTTGETNIQTTLGNFSNPTSSNEDAESRVSMTYLVLVGITFWLLVVVAVIGNILVVAAVFKDERLRRNLHSYFIVSLAVADIMISMAVMPLAAVNDLSGWVFLPSYCEIWITTDVMGCTASILNLCAIAFVRYKTIQDPLQCHNWLTPRKVSGLIAAVWLLSFIISVVPIQLNWHVPSNPESDPVPPSDETATDGVAFVCFIDFSAVYGVISSMISFYIPAAIMLYYYAKLFLIARKHAKTIKTVTTAYPPLVQVTQTDDRKRGRPKCISSRLKNRLARPQIRGEHKAICTLGVMMGVFLACWLPFFCIYLTASLCKACISNSTFQVCTWLGYSSSCFNPIIYSVFNREFRKAFRRLITPDCIRRYCNYNLEDSYSFVNTNIAYITRSLTVSSSLNTNERRKTSCSHSSQFSLKVHVPFGQHLHIRDERKDCVEASASQDQDNTSVPQEGQDNTMVHHERRANTTVLHEDQDNATVSHEIQDNTTASNEGQDNSTVYHDGQDNITVPHEV